MTSRFALLRSSLALAIASGATFLVVAGSAAPAGASEVRSVAISTDGIDLASPAGAARIQAEIDRAAQHVCSTGDDRAATAAIARHACIKSALAAAMPHLDSLAADARDARTAVADAAPTASVRR